MGDHPRFLARGTHVLVVELDNGDNYIVVSLSTRQDTQVIAIDPTTGALRFTGRWGIDHFPSELDAIHFLTSEGRTLIKSRIEGRAILGYAAVGQFALILVATKTRVSIPALPGGDSVQLVTDSQWKKIPLRSPQPQPLTELKNIAELTESSVDGCHYFCETRDLTRPFPSGASVGEPDREYVWNEWLATPFKRIGLPRHCVVLMQGVAESRIFPDSSSRPVVVSLIARRSRLHPGTRYLARGLNPAASTGNEIECEQLVFPAENAPGKPVPFSAYLWRRGTVPIWWGAEIKSTMAEAEIYVCDDRAFEGSGRYYKRLERRYTGDGRSAADGKARATPVVCVNLLRTQPGKPELPLAEAFQDMASELRDSRPSSSVVTVLNYDWHATTKAVGEPKTIEGLWNLLRNPMADIGVSLGEWRPPGGATDPGNLPPGMVKNAGLGGGAYHVDTKQSGVVRYNCADSLDRTNAASFFGAVQALSEQCRLLGLDIDVSARLATSSGPSYELDAQPLSTQNRSMGPRLIEGPLPAGWEKRKDPSTNKAFYIDHNTRKTTWDHPNLIPASPLPDITVKPSYFAEGDGSTGSVEERRWSRFAMGFEEVKGATLSAPLEAMSDMFMVAGDIHASLYSGSKAMHSHILHIFSEDGAKVKKASTAANVAITLQRRYMNMVVDSSRQKQFEMFLGLRRHRHLPTQPDAPLQALTRPHAFVLKPVPAVYPSLFAPQALLTGLPKGTAWVCPSAAEVLEVFIFLSEPCRVSQLVIGVAHGVDDSTVPRSFDVRAGRTLDALNVLLEGAGIPKCAPGTQLLYNLPGSVPAEDKALTGSARGKRPGEQFSSLYDFEEAEGAVDYLTRFVTVTFYPSAPGIPLTLGSIEVLGTSLVGKVPGVIQPSAKSNSHEPLPVADLLSIGEPVRASNGHSAPATWQPPAASQPAPAVSPSAAVNAWDPFGVVPFPATAATKQDGGAGIPTPVSGTNPFSGWDPFAGPQPGSSSPISDPFEFVHVQEPKPQTPAPVTNGVSPSQPSSAASGGRKNVASSFGGQIGLPSATPRKQDSVVLTPVSGDGVAVNTYLRMVKSVLGAQQTARFADCMELDIARLRLGLSAAQRDRALLSVGRDPGSLDPNRTLSISDSAPLRVAANQLSTLVRVAQEDRELAAMADAGLGIQDRLTNPVIENDLVKLQGCLNGGCDVGRGGLANGGLSHGEATPLKQCSDCQKRACAACLTGPGAGLLKRHRESKLRVEAPEAREGGAKAEPKGPPPQDQPLCKKCCPALVRDAVLVDRVRKLSAARRRVRLNAAGVQDGEFLHSLSAASAVECKAGQGNLRDGRGVAFLGAPNLAGESLAEYPYAGLLFSVPTAEGSAPAESLLASPSSSKPLGQFWRAPAVGNTAVDIAIALATPGNVHRLALEVSPCGYTQGYDTPLIDIAVGSSIAEKDYVGRWDIAAAASAAPHVLGADQSPNPKPLFRTLVYNFPQGGRTCRIVWLRFSLRSDAAANPFAAHPTAVGLFDLLSLDPNPAAGGEPPKAPACVHASRILVLGERIIGEPLSLAPQASERLALKTVLEQPPRVVRIRVPSEFQDVKPSGGVIELGVDPRVPAVGGFRLDALGLAQKVPALGAEEGFEGLSVCSGDEMATAAVALTVRVYAVQSEGGAAAPIPVGDFILPAARQGTALYFDFPKPVTARIIVVELVGDVSTCGDEGDDDSKDSLSAFSLKDRVRLYRYALPQEAGKWPQLNAP